jgi:molecular chaperone GrpE
MFFKKKKTMSHNKHSKEQHMDENADNMAQNEEQQHTEDALLNETDTENESQEANDAYDAEHAEKLKAELQEMKDKYLRLAAEFDNAKRRNAKERIELTQTAGKEIVQSLLTVLDDSERAARQIENAKDIDAIKEGLSLVFNKLRTILQSKGLRVMESANQDFDADLHDAITEIPAPTEALKGKIIDVIEPGYYLNDKLIRHAKVVVGK